MGVEDDGGSVADALEPCGGHKQRQKMSFSVLSKQSMCLVRIQIRAFETVVVLNRSSFWGHKQRHVRRSQRVVVLVGAALTVYHLAPAGNHRLQLVR